MYKRIKTLLRIIKHKDFKNKDLIKTINDRVLIVGNGPSISKVDLKSFVKKNIQLCCVNSFAGENESFFELRPKYYCAIDPEVYSNDPRVVDENGRIYNALKRVDWDMYYICLYNQKLPFDNNCIHYCYLPTTVSDDVQECFYFLKHSMARFKCQNVINACLYYFITAQAKDVLLVGIETDWHKELFVGIDNNVYREKKHFYGEYMQNVTEIGLIKKGELYKYFEFYANTLKCFWISSQYAEKMKVNVVNLTTNSYVDCFEKRDYKEFLKEI